MKTRKGVFFTVRLVPVTLTDRLVLEFIAKRQGEDSRAMDIAKGIVGEVKARGFSAVSEFTSKFDGVAVGKEEFVASKQEISNAAKSISPELFSAMKEMRERLERFARSQRKSMKDVVEKTADGTTTLSFRPVSRVGIYVPAGRAPLFSSLFMAAVPAIAAGAEELIVFTPPQKDGKCDARILAAAGICGIKKIYKAGGAQAIAAMAFGLPGILGPVDVICGPGNAYVSAAKRIVASQTSVRIDVPAGPSEVLVIADKTADAEMCAADMLAQAEHGPDSAAICICTDEKKADEIAKEIGRQLNALPESSAANISIPKWGRIFVASDLESAIAASEMIAPEHLELMVGEPEGVAARMRNAGAVFIRTGEVFCDYGMSGGNHILPTNGAARAWGGVSVQTFGKWVYVDELTAGAQKKLAKTAALLAREEGLEAHARAAEARKKSKRK